jgi:hypothetical protein
MDHPITNNKKRLIQIYLLVFNFLKIKVKFKTTKKTN